MTTAKASFALRAQTGSARPKDTRRAVRAAVVGMIGSWTALAGQASCTETELRCTGPQCGNPLAAVVDNVVTAQGKVCTLNPETSIFPYRIILVVDISGSNRQSDPPAIQGRLRAAQQAIDENLAKPGVSFALVTFSSAPADEIPGFTNDAQILANRLPVVDRRDGFTNYVDTLQLLNKIITDDLAAMDPIQVPYAQYDIQWLSDGAPMDPQGGGPPGAERCNDRTTRQAVQREENALIALQDKLGFFKIKFSTIFLSAGQEVSECVSVLMQPDKWDTGDVYLKEMVRNGGSFQISTSAKLKFNIKVDPITHSFVQQNFFLVDMSRVVDHDQLKADSDQDGVADEVESGLLKTNPLVADTSGVGCNDRVIQLYDVDNPGRCVSLCSNDDATAGGAAGGLMADVDGDGLLACSEKYLRSNDRKSDSDMDEFPDPTELRFGTPSDQPFKETQDTDVDGILDADEIRQGLDPLTPQSNRQLAYNYLPLVKVDSDNPSVTCYTFEVQNVRLVETQATKTTGAGDNNLCLTMVQHASDNLNAQPVVSRACKTASFQMANGVSTLTPANGLVSFAPGDFQPVMCLGTNCSELAPKSAATPLPVPVPLPVP